MIPPTRAARRGAHRPLLTTTSAFVVCALLACAPVEPKGSGRGGASGAGSHAGGGGGLAGEPGSVAGQAGDGSGGGAGKNPGGHAGSEPTDERPSCGGRKTGCGGDGQADCCARSVVEGATYLQGRGPTDDAAGVEAEKPEHATTVGTFALDRYEATVGRFRRFLDAGAPSPTVGTNGHPGYPETAWQSAWNARLPADREAWNAALVCHAHATWTDEPGEREDLPINCLGWYAAYAFCAWDGARLPAEAEWELAAAGGDQNRRYPWGKSSPVAEQASFHPEEGCNGDGLPSCNVTDIRRPGAYPLGVGRYGHFELAGNVAEWMLDAFDEGFYAGEGQACVDCVSTKGTNRGLRGGSFQSESFYLRAASRFSWPPDSPVVRAGVRCVQSVGSAP